MSNLIVDNLEMGDMLINKDNCRIKVYSAEKVKLKKGGQGLACLLAKIDELVDPENRHSHPLENELFVLTENGKINLGENFTAHLPK